MHIVRSACPSRSRFHFPPAAGQLEHAVKEFGCGAALSVTSWARIFQIAKYDPFWAKSRNSASWFSMHPQSAGNLVKPMASRESDLGQHHWESRSRPRSVRTHRGLMEL